MLWRHQRSGERNGNPTGLCHAPSPAPPPPPLVIHRETRDLTFKEDRRTQGWTASRNVLAFTETRLSNGPGRNGIQGWPHGKLRPVGRGFPKILAACQQTARDASAGAHRIGGCGHDAGNVAPVRGTPVSWLISSISSRDFLS